MRVRILSGNQTGTIVEQSEDEAQVNIVTGFAEVVAPEAVTVGTPMAPVAEAEAPIVEPAPAEPAP